MGAFLVHVKNIQYYHAQLLEDSNYFYKTAFHMVTCENTLSFLVSCALTAGQNSPYLKLEVWLRILVDFDQVSPLQFSMMVYDLP